jgi:hypothetical protein
MYSSAFSTFSSVIMVSLFHRRGSGSLFVPA